MSYPDAAWERAMTVQEVMLKALSGELHWFRAADILGWSPRTLRRWRERYERHGYVGLVDKRLHRPSIRRVAAPEVGRLLQLYRERYQGFNVRHFHQIARREHGVTVSYSFLKHTLQAAGLVKKHRARGRHRRRREPRACFGERLHLDGSVHEWFTLAPDERPCLIAVSDDATKRVLQAAFYASESRQAVMTSLAAVLRTEGIPMALYTDRAHWAFHTPSAKGPVDKTQLTQAANVYLAEHFVPQHNATFARAPRDPASAFVALGSADLDAILCHEETRIVARDNTVSVGKIPLQISAQPGRRSCVGLQVTVRHHRDGRITISQGARVFATFTATGQPVPAPSPRTRANRKTDPRGCPRNDDRPGARDLVSPGSHGEPTLVTL